MALVKSTDENYKELIATKGKLTLIKFTADWCGEQCPLINWEGTTLHQMDLVKP